MSTKQSFVIDVECILHIACRVIERKIEFCEVIIIILNLRAFKCRKTKAYERLTYLTIHYRKRIKLAERNCLNSGQSNVQSFLLVPAFFSQLNDCRLAGSERLGKGLFCGICRLSKLRAFFRRKLTH